MQQQAFVVEAETETGIKAAEAWITENLGLSVQGNPDVAVLRYSLLSVEDARKIVALAGQGAFRGETRAIVIAAGRAYHEAQNALLKLFEEPAPGLHLFLILPTLGNLLPTLRSRVQVLSVDGGEKEKNESADEFMRADVKKRTALITKLASGKDEEGRRANREKAIAIVDGVEARAYAAFKKDKSYGALLQDIETVRHALFDRSAPVRMILEHLSLVMPKDLR